MSLTALLVANQQLTRFAAVAIIMFLVPEHHTAVATVMYITLCRTSITAQPVLQNPISRPSVEERTSRVCQPILDSGAPWHCGNSGYSDSRSKV